LIRVVDTRSIVRQVALEAFGEARGRPIFDGNRRIGTVHESADAIYCFIEEIVADQTQSREDQTISIFETIERVLRAEGMEFGHLVRTWFYLDHILDWYDEFNQARTPFLEARGAFEGLVPASTGIGIANRFGAAAVAGALAIKPKEAMGATVMEVASPMQCSALAYKSSFSRAVEVVREGRRELYISGTASIEPGGKTVRQDDPRGQIDLTMEVVAALLDSRRMDWSHCTRAIAYLKHPRDAFHFTEYLREHGLEQMPVTVMHSDVCRHDLLFEIELDAVEDSFK
jgi:enamine deaminase RidA (YjgF/YER057c/UK114 family)